MLQSIKLVFKNSICLKYKVSEVWYLEAREDFIDFALNNHKEIDDLKKYQCVRNGSYRIPLKDLKFSGLQLN